MKLLALLPLAVLAADVVVASVVPARHHRLARRLSRKKRCLSRPQNSIANVSHSSATSPQVTYPTSTTPPPAQQQPTTTTTTADQAPPTTSSPPTYNPPPQPQTGVINVASTCGDIGATSDPTKTSGPNGSIYWLNCGIQGGGWNPPQFSVNQVIAKDLGDVLNRPGNPYDACRQHLDAFYKAANQYNVPAILLAAIAMQESSCNANTIGANGEQGLMQITPDKCPGGYASDGCREPYTNIDIGARFGSHEGEGSHGGFGRCGPRVTSGPGPDLERGDRRVTTAALSTRSYFSCSSISCSSYPCQPLVAAHIPLSLPSVFHHVPAHGLR
jgi:hypothetical protein